MKRFEAGSLIPGATWHAEADTVAEVVSRAVASLKAHHGETDIRPDMIERIKQRIVDVDAPSAPTRH